MESYVNLHGILLISYMYKHVMSNTDKQAEASMSIQ